MSTTQSIAMGYLDIAAQVIFTKSRFRRFAMANTPKLPAEKNPLQHPPHSRWRVQTRGGEEGGSLLCL